jgi:4-aminobutyrate aminotransferase-like enzyme
VYLKMGLEVLSRRYNVIAGVRGMGLMLALALRNEGTEEKSLGDSLVDAALKNGLVIFGGLRSENSDFVMIAPPLIIKKDEVDLLIELLGRAFDGLEQERESLASDAR